MLLPLPRSDRCRVHVGCRGGEGIPSIFVYCGGLHAFGIRQASSVLCDCGCTARATYSKARSELINTAPAGPGSPICWRHSDLEQAMVPCALCTGLGPFQTPCCHPVRYILLCLQYRPLAVDSLHGDVCPSGSTDLHTLLTLRHSDCCLMHNLTKVCSMHAMILSSLIVTSLLWQISGEACLVSAGKDLVLWSDAQDSWKCFEDLCPHRKVPLSEGRVEGGNLQCAYHGWNFNATGQPVNIPQVC